MDVKQEYDKFVSVNKKSLEKDYNLLVFSLMYEVIDCIRWANNNVELNSDELEKLYSLVHHQINKNYPQAFKIDFEEICAEMGYEF